MGKADKDIAEVLRGISVRLEVLGGTKGRLIQIRPVHQPAQRPSRKPRRPSRKPREDRSGGQQRRRARIVLRRIWPEGYPTRDQVPDVDLQDRFAKEYDKVEGKANPPSRLKMPS